MNELPDGLPLQAAYTFLRRDFFVSGTSRMLLSCIPCWGHFGVAGLSQVIHPFGLHSQHFNLFSVANVHAWYLQSSHGCHEKAHWLFI